MWLDSRSWAKRAAEGAFVPEDVQVLLREIGAKDALLDEARRALEPFAAMYAGQGMMEDILRARGVIAKLKASAP